MRASLVTFLLTLASQAESDCSKLCDFVWWQTATTADVQAELDSGANVKGQKEYGSTPLVRTARYGSAASIKILLDGGVDAKATDRDGNVSWDHAEFNQNLKETKDYWPLWTAPLIDFDRHPPLISHKPPLIYLPTSHRPYRACEGQA